MGRSNRMPASQHSFLWVDPIPGLFLDCCSPDLGKISSPRVARKFSIIERAGRIEVLGEYNLFTASNVTSFVLSLSLIRLVGGGTDKASAQVRIRCWEDHMLKSRREALSHPGAELL
jgi:hypothetical protein